VWGKELFFDATKVRANADIDSLVPRWYQAAKTHLDDLFTDAADEGTRPQASATAKDRDNEAEVTPLPFAGPADAEAELAETNRAAWKLLEQYRLDPQRPPSGSYRRQTDLVVSRTDPDAAPLQTGERAKLGYRDQDVVDGGRARIILAALVMPGDVMDNAPMLDLLRRVQFRWHLHPERAVGDAKYGTVENIRALEDAGIRAYVPLPDFDRRTPYFGASHFAYDPEQDRYRCPQGQPLPRRRVKHTEEVVVYRAEAAACNGCSLKERCTASAAGRQVRRSFHAASLDRVRAYHETASYRKAMRKRAVWVEPLFGEAKDWHGLRRFRLRGLWKVNCEALRIAAGQNRKRWLSRTGWGRRHGPAGSLALSPSLRPRPVLACVP
jgi:Transposase DDE domain